MLSGGILKLSIDETTSPKTSSNATVNATMESDDAKYDDRRYDGMVSVDQCIGALQTVLMIFIGLYLFMPVSLWGAAEYGKMGDGCPRICPRPEICSQGWIEIGLITVSRFAAQFMLVPLAVVFLTKARIASSRYNLTIMSLILPLSDLHTVHEKAGKQIAVAGTIHALCHVARWIKRGDHWLFSQHPIGKSGVIAAVCLIPVVGLQLDRIQEKFSFEFRKGCHFVFGVCLGVSLLWHTRVLFCVLLVALGVYGIDFVYTTFFATYRIEHSEFTRLGTGVQLTFQEPPGWPQEVEGYVNVLVPWISRTQLHPFSMYKSHRPGYSCVFMLSSGDWTRSLHASIARDTKRPVWIQGPFPSPFGEHAANFDNMLLVSTGVGITPAISSIQKFAHTGRTVSLIWSCRDPSLISFYVFQLSIFDACALTLIYYTGTQPIDLHEAMPPHIRILPSRPDLVRVVPDVIHCVEQNIALPASLQGKAATFLLEMNDIYAGIIASETARLRFDGIILNCLKRGASQTDIVDFFFGTEFVVPSTSLVRATSKPLIMPWRVDPAIRHSNHRLGSGLPVTTTPPTGTTPVTGLVLDNAAFGRAYAALATTMTSVTPDDVAEILESICGFGATGITRDDLDRTVGALAQVKNEVLKNQYTAAQKERKRSSMRRTRSDLEAGADDGFDDPDDATTPKGGFPRIFAKADLWEETSPTESPPPSPPKPDLAVARQFHKRWALMYCGGSIAVLNTLRDISTDLDIQLNVDRFNW